MFQKKDLDPPRGAKWMVKGAIKQFLRVQTPPLGGCWEVHLQMVDFLFPKSHVTFRECNCWIPETASLLGVQCTETSHSQPLGQAA